jgi:hypothetical protein
MVHPPAIHVATPYGLNGSQNHMVNVHSIHPTFPSIILPSVSNIFGTENYLQTKEHNHGECLDIKIITLSMQVQGISMAPLDRHAHMPWAKLISCLVALSLSKFKYQHIFSERYVVNFGTCAIFCKFDQAPIQHKKEMRKYILSL